MSTKSQHERRLYDKQKALKARVCPTCKNIGYIFEPVEANYTGKMFVKECPECNY